jgi:hypothetical protein
VRHAECDIGRLKGFSKGQLKGEELLTLLSMNLTNTQLVQGQFLASYWLTVGIFSVSGFLLATCSEYEIGEESSVLKYL